MPMLSVKSYKKASDLNNTLASANLAYRLMNAGFDEEASAILEHARQQTDLHPNVGSALASLSEKQEAEREKHKKIIESAIKQQRFYRAFSEIYFRSLNEGDENIEGAWRLEDGTDVQVTQNDSTVEANWLVLNNKHQFTGAVTNRTLRITKKKMEYNWYPKRSEKGFEKEYEGYAYLSEDNQRLSIMYVNGNEPIFVTMLKKDVSNDEI